MTDIYCFYYDRLAARRRQVTNVCRHMGLEGNLSREHSLKKLLSEAEFECLSHVNDRQMVSDAASRTQR